MGLDPIRTAENIRQSYIRYLATSFPLNDHELENQFKEHLARPDYLTKGPILESTPPYRPGKSLEDLIGQGVLNSRFESLESSHFPLSRPLYQHQEEAIYKVVNKNRNIIIATGTGSGKTECFLIPILNHLFSELGKSRLNPGVRALLLYPMNALANDQLKRMRRLLSNSPNITFGRYTGETKERKREAEEHFRRNYPAEPRIPNELLSREEMRQTPPHILLTNYAMLEYLLLRPDDCEFFDGPKAQHWRFLILDETHNYNGAMGIEIAMLIRRLKDRIVRSQPGHLLCIGTSATLGRGREDFPQIAKFASQLFGEKFEWIENDSSRQDIVEAVRISHTELGAIWGYPDARLYEVLN